MRPDPFDAETLRRLSIEQPVSPATRVLMLVGGILLLAAVLELVRRGRLREEYTPIWVVAALGAMILSVWFDGVRLLTSLVGAWTPSSVVACDGALGMLASNPVADRVQCTADALTREEGRASIRSSPAHVRGLVEAAGGAITLHQRYGLLFPNVTPLAVARLLVRLPFHVPVVAISQLIVAEPRARA